MSPFLELKFASTQSRRLKAVSQVMPLGDAWSYFAVLSDAYLTTANGDTRIRSFADLQLALDCEDSLQALSLARESGRLTEGRHVLPDLVASWLCHHGAATSSVRRWKFGGAEPMTELLPTSELYGVWAGSDTEEIEVADDSAQWYFRMRDDEPLVFLATKAHSLASRLRQCSAHCCEIDGSFTYAR
ncbi:MAG: hypothetical protein JNL30_17930 [Rubrivivax sp.]|nr:hypothetical protein [Rubrivivax sp.]